MKDWNEPFTDYFEEPEEEPEEIDEDKAFEAYAERIRHKLERYKDQDCDEPREN